MIHVGIDIDDTLCDFITPLNTYYNLKYGKSFLVSNYTSQNFSSLWGISDDEAQTTIKSFIFDESKMSSTLEPIPGAFETLSKLKSTNKYMFHAVSARHIELKQSTEEWLQKHFPGIFSSITLCNYYGDGEKRTKEEVYKQLGIKICIDDRVEQYSSTLQLVYSQPWNSKSNSDVEFLYSKDLIHVDWSSVEKTLSFSSLLSLYKPLSHTLVIGFSGKLGSGKDTCADILQSINSIFHRYSFAERLKNTVATLTNTTYQENCSRDGKKLIPKGFDFSLGQLQQKIGEGLRQIIDDNIWIRPVVESCKGLCLITDCRYPNEAKAIEQTGIVIRIDGDPMKIREKNEDNRDLMHSSEVALDDYPFRYRIENNSSLEDLKIKLLDIVIGHIYG